MTNIHFVYIGNSDFRFPDPVDRYSETQRTNPFGGKKVLDFTRILEFQSVLD